jgi:uncharacterized membrane protein YfhO
LPRLRVAPKSKVLYYKGESALRRKTKKRDRMENQKQFCADAKKPLPRAAGWALLLILTAAAFSFALWRCGIYPFGPNTILLVDLGGQYTDFLLFFRNSSFLEKIYSFTKGFGGQTIGLSAYYLLSPFNLLTYLFPRKKIEAAVVCILYAKLLCIACCAKFYFSRHGARFSVLFALFYALSPYVMTYWFNLLWLDGFALLPLLVYGCEQLLEKGRMRFFAIAYFCALLTNYYIAYMSSIFILFYFFFYGCARLALPLRQLIGRVGRIALCVVLDFCLAAPVLLPTLAQLKSGKLTGSAGLSGLLQGSRMFNPLLIFANIFTGSFMYETVPFLFFTAGTLLLFLAFFASDAYSLRQKLGTAMLWGFLALSLFWHPLYYIWHAFQEPEGFYFRFYFVYWFFLLTICRQGLDGLARLRQKPFWAAAGAALAGCGTFYLSTRTSLPWGAHTAWLTLFGVLVLAVCIAAAAYRGNPKQNPAGERQGRALRLPAPLAAGCRKHAVPALACALAVLLLADSSSVFCRAYATSPTANTAPDYEQNYAVKSALLAHTEAGGFYRVEDLSQRPCDQQMALGYCGTTHFSSTYDAAQKEMYIHFGYPDTFMSTTYNHSALLTDSLWGIRYLMAAEGTAVDADYTQIAAESGFALYENPYALPLLFTMQDTEIPYDPDGNVHLSALYRVLSGGQEVYDASTQEANRSVLAEAGKTAQSAAAEVISRQGGFVTATVTAKAGQMLAAMIPYDTAWHVTVDGKPVQTEPFLTYYMSVPLCAGEHTVRMVYVPTGLGAGCGLCLGALAVLAAAWGIRRKRANAKKGASALATAKSD